MLVPSRAHVRSERPRLTESGWSRVLVYGLGRSGHAASRLLLSRGVSVLGYDERSPDAAALERSSELATLAERAGVSFELATGETITRVPEQVDAVVLSPGVPRSRPLVEEALGRGLEVVAEVELAYRALDDDFGAMVAITGSNGKSTTTALAGHLLAAAGHDVEVCGNIGEPMSERVDGGPGRVFVLELSSFQLESTDSLHPDVAVLLNVTPDHLDRYSDFEQYRSAKERIFLRQGEGDVAVLNADDPPSTGLERLRCRRFSLTRPVEDGCYLDTDRVIEVGENTREEIFRLADLPLVGRHNLENAMAAALAARSLGRLCGAEPPEVASALPSFAGLPHRMQQVARVGGVLWLDDSKGTNTAATERSLEGFDDGRVHLILGGRSKESDLDRLHSAVERKVKCLYLIGESASQFERALGTAAPVRMAGTLERAVEWAAAAAEGGDVVLLSPACASFDQFRDFVDRGLTFQRLVRSLERRVAEAGAEGEHG